MMKRISALLISILLAGTSSTFAASTQVDSLIEKLVEKDILTQQEARQLKAEITTDEKLLREEAFQQNLPKWVQDIKLKGDFRLRYQYERRKNDTEARSRGRIRYRMGVESKINEKVKVAAGLATGESADSRSTNQSLTDAFQHPDIRLDYAYAEFQPYEWFKIAGGKHLRPDYLWAPTDLLWDSDINPEGGAFSLTHKFYDGMDGFLNGGIWVVDENNKVDVPDPFMNFAQAGAKMKSGAADVTVAGIYYGFHGAKGAQLNNTACSNSGLSGSSTSCAGTLTNDYDSVGGAFEAGLENPLDMESIERVALFGDYIHNFDPSDDENGWAAGIKLGDKKVAGPSQWQARYQYSYLGRDAFPDSFPDSDRIGGATDLKGHETILEYGLGKNVVLSLDYYQDSRIKSTKNPQRLVQADINFKF